MQPQKDARIIPSACYTYSLADFVFTISIGDTTNTTFKSGIRLNGTSNFIFGLITNGSFSAIPENLLVNIVTSTRNNNPFVTTGVAIETGQMWECSTMPAEMIGNIFIQEIHEGVAKILFEAGQTGSIILIVMKDVDVVALQKALSYNFLQK